MADVTVTLTRDEAEALRWVTDRAHSLDWGVYHALRADVRSAIRAALAAAEQEGGEDAY